MKTIEIMMNYSKTIKHLNKYKTYLTWSGSTIILDAMFIVYSTRRKPVSSPIHQYNTLHEEH